MGSFRIGQDQLQMTGILAQHIAGDLNKRTGIALPHVRYPAIYPYPAFPRQLDLGNGRIRQAPAVSHGIEHGANAHPPALEPAGPGLPVRLIAPQRMLL